MKINSITNWFETFNPKKKPPKKSKKNVLEHNKFVLRPEDLFGDNGSLEKIITSLSNKMDEFRIHEGFKEGWWLNSENKRSSMYKPEGIISNDSATKILNSYLYMEDVNPNTNCISSGDKKGTELKGGIIPAVIFLHPQNLLQLCPNCEKFYNKMNTKLFQQGNLPSHEMRRIKEWVNSGLPFPKARLKNNNITELKNFDGKIIFNSTTPGLSFVKRVNEMYAENWKKIGIEEDMFKSHKKFKSALETK